MGRLLKILLYAAIGVVAFLIVAATAIYLFFDPNDYRDDISAAVEETTGRPLVIEGDLGFNLFPWLAIDVGRSSLGNAPGFGDEPFLSFERARLSVRLLPLLLRHELGVGAASLDGLRVNLAVAGNGHNNWEDLAAGEEEAAAEPGTEGPGVFDIAGVQITDAGVRYTDAQLGETWELRNVNLKTGRIAAGEPVAFSAGFDFALQPADLSGDFAIDATVAFDGDAGTLAFSDVHVHTLGLDVEAEVAPFSIAADFAPVAEIEVAPFSLKVLMAGLGIEPLETADPDALGHVELGTTARVSPAAIALDDLRLIVDDTTFEGTMAVARDEAGTITVELSADRIDLDRYMAPAAEEAAAEADEVPVEVPVDLIRALNARGSLTVGSAQLAGMTFDDVRVGIDSTNGRLRLHPLSARLFEGSYEGDVRIDASAATPVLAADEKIRGVDVGALVKAMFDQDNISGTINGTFSLTGRGADLSHAQRSLNGKMSFELLDGAYEGRDIWYELRRARALLKKEPEPEPELPPRTPFSSVRLSGPVTDGVFRNDDLLAELPFMQLSGSGSVDLAAATIDYRLAARVLEKPEFMPDATAEELEDFTRGTIPLSITGPIAAPSIKPDLGTALKRKAKERLRERLVDRLGGAEDAAPAGEEAEAEKDDEEKVEDALRDLLKQ